MRTRLARALFCTAPVILLGLLFFGCRARQEEAPKPKEPEPTIAPEVKVLATVNGDPITLAEFNERFQRAGFRPEKEAEIRVKQDFLSRLIERKMLVKEAQRRRLKVGVPEILKRIDAMQAEQGDDMKGALAGMGVDFEKFKSDVWETLMIEKLISLSLPRRAHASSGEVRRYYQENAQEFERPEQVRVRQIVVATEQEAQRLLDQVLAGADFAELARQRSTAPEAAEGGDLGYFAMGEMPGEFNVVFGLPKGGVSTVVKSAYGFHIFKLENKRRPGKVPIDEAWKDIAEKLEHRKQDERYQQFLRELRNRTKFVVNYEGLQEGQ
jgi:peptidyl-prolyl cis-trans isomerase C